MKSKRALFSFNIELTARCNNNCKHCYINLPSGDLQAKSSELTLNEIETIADEAVKLGAVWCTITGGEPLLRQDFEKIYLMLKHKGLLLSLFTNATLFNEKHIKLIKKYPPRDIEVTVYGATKDTYEKVTNQPGSYDLFIRGLNLLMESGVKIRLKAMALRDNIDELDKISEFCREYTKDYYRFDPLLHLRYDGDPIRNDEIRFERLSPEEIVILEKNDPERFNALQNKCDDLVNPELSHRSCNHLFHCGAGTNSFNVTYDGKLKLCSSLYAPGTVYDLRKGTVKEAWEEFIPKVRDMRSDREEFLNTCHNCELVNLCLWCPAQAYLEMGEMDGATPYFCAVAHARAAIFKSK